MSKGILSETKLGKIVDEITMKSVTCDYCGFMWSRADHKQCPNCKPEGTEHISKEWDKAFEIEYKQTGTTIAEEQAKTKTIAQYRDDIIEIACELRRSCSSTDSELCDAVDAYHKALREKAREVE